MIQYILLQLIFSNEFIYNRKILSYQYKWSLIRFCVIKSVFFIKKKWYTIKNTLCINSLLIYDIQKNLIDTYNYEYFIKQILIYTF